MNDIVDRLRQPCLDVSRHLAIEAADEIVRLRGVLRTSALIIEALCRAHETLRVHNGDLPNTSHSVNDGRDFLAALKEGKS